MTEPLTDARLQWARTFTGLDIPGVTGPNGPPAPLAFNPPPDQPPGGPAVPPVAAVPVKAGPPTDPATEQAQSDITRKFHVNFPPVTALPTSISDPKPWKVQEVGAASRALDAIPTADTDVLKGMDFKRVDELPEGKNTLAEFQDMADSRTGTASRTIFVADGTFATGGNQQTLSPDEPKRRVIHEVGHAVAHKARDIAQAADAKAVKDIVDAGADYKKAQDEHEAWKKTFTGPDPGTELEKVQNELPKDAAGRKAKDKKIRELLDEIKRRDKLEEPFATKQSEAGARMDAARKVREKTQADLAATKVPPRIVEAGLTEMNAASAAAHDQLDRAAPELTKLSGAARKESLDYRQSSSAAGMLLQTFADAIKDGKVGPSDNQKSPGEWDKDLDFVFSGRESTRKALSTKAPGNQALTILTPVDRAQNEFRKKVDVQARLPERVPKVQEFVELVQQSPAIDPVTISDYAANSWPAKPEELFAEAYSLWRMNSTNSSNKGVRTLPDRLWKWFDNGSYR